MNKLIHTIPIILITSKSNFILIKKLCLIILECLKSNEKIIFPQILQEIPGEILMYNKILLPTDGSEILKKQINMPYGLQTRVMQIL